jgi:hypothetical protein
MDYSALTITDDPAVWTDLETGALCGTREQSRS